MLKRKELERNLLANQVVILIDEFFLARSVESNGLQWKIN
jgi:hypothetical protein